MFGWLEEMRARIELALAYARGARSSTVVPNPSWSVADWYVDPVAGSDANPGTLAKPVKTIMGGVVAKWGTSRPTLIQNTTIHLLTPETPGQEDVVLQPVVARGAWFAVVGTPILVSTFAIGAVTPRVRGNPGQLLQAAGFVAAGIKAGGRQLVINDTHPSRSMTASVVAGLATLAQPVGLVTPAADASNFPALPPPRVDTWAPGDVVHVYDLPLLNLRVWEPAGGDTTASAIGGAAWLQSVHVPDPSGIDGSSYLAFTGTISGCVPWMVDCVVDAYVELLGQSGGGTYGGFATNCYWSGGGEVLNASMWSGIAALFGIGVSDFGAIDGDTITNSVGLFGGSSAFVGAVYVSTSYISYGGGNGKLDPTAYGINALWGPGSCSLTDASTMQLVGSTWTASLFLSPLTIEGVGTGTSYAAGVWTDGIALTPANLDIHGTLQNPRTGCKFYLNA